MNNNRGNNRRRGRGNNRQQGGGGQQLNRIDSRARGNAPQLLEKYRKLAHDAHLNGDRVNAEYYLQFADHYFRVIADTRVRQEEQRSRRDDRGEGEPFRDETDDSGDFSVEADFPAFDQPPVYTRREREDRPERSERADRPERSERPERGDRPERGERGERSERGDRNDRPRREPREDRAAQQVETREVAESEDGSESVPAVSNPYEPQENPFVRETGTRGLRPRRGERRPRNDEGDAQGETLALDPASLPPSIAREPAPVEADAASDDAAAEAKPRRRRTVRKPAGDAGEAVEQVG